MKIKELLKSFILWRFVMCLLTIPAALLFPLKDGFTHLASSFVPANFLTLWSNFDGRHFLSLAHSGYSTPTTYQLYAFFPVFPWLIRNLNIFGSELVTALIISNLCSFLALIVLYKLVRLDFSKKIATTSLLLLGIFPTAFFLGAAYSESLFLLLIVSAFLAIRKKQLLIACILASIASATRFSGILLWPAIILEVYQANGSQLSKLIRKPSSIFLLFPPLGLFSYMNFLYLKTGNALYFLTGQTGSEGSWLVQKIILLYQVFFRYLKMLIFINHRDPLFFTVLLEFIVGAVFISLIIMSFKKLRQSYAIYSLLIYIVPTFTGSFASLPRYVLAAFPVFILLAVWFERQTPIVKKIYFIISLVLAFISVSLFSRGYFVS